MAYRTARAPFSRWAAAVGGLVLATASTAWGHEVTLSVVDASGQPIPARVQVRDGSGTYYPGFPDGTLMSHRDWPWMGGYFYVDGPVVMELAPGTAEIYVAHGFEHRPLRVQRLIDRDLSINVILVRYFDLRAEGWHGGDVHAHTQHTPSDYLVSPQQARRVVEAEDIAMAWLPDFNLEFTGGPHALSTPDHLMYYMTEYRNQACGHVCMLGQTEIMPPTCCGVTSPVSPLLSDLREDWNPTASQAMVLSHPCTGADFFDDGGWPAWGLGREVPVMAATGNLDAYDIASLSNVGDLVLTDWYRLLDTGFRVPPSAGTDTSMGQYWTRPAGCYRVFVDTGVTDLTYQDWVASLRAGRCFVSNLPLITDFSVDGVPAGGQLDIDPGDPVEVSFRVRSVLRVATAKVIVNGVVAHTFDLPTASITNVQLTHQMPIPESAWVAIRVDGTTDMRTTPRAELFAHTGAVYITAGEAPLRKTDHGAFFIDWCDSLRLFAEERGNWSSDQERTHVLDRIASAQDVFRDLFVESPPASSLLVPAAGDTVAPNTTVTFGWTKAVDPEPGDRVAYRVEFRPDSLSSIELTVESADTSAQINSGFSGDFEWRVIATDLGKHETGAVWRPIYFYQSTTAAPLASEVALGPVTLLASPNPTSSSVTFTLGDEATTGLLVVHDVVGRRVRELEWTRVKSLTWDARDDFGRPVPNGVYWAWLDERSGRITRAVVHIVR